MADREQVVGVAGMDFSMNHLFYHLTEAYSECDSREYT